MSDALTLLREARGVLAVALCPQSDEARELVARIDAALAAQPAAPAQPQGNAAGLTVDWMASEQRLRCKACGNGSWLIFNTDDQKEVEAVECSACHQMARVSLPAAPPPAPEEWFAATPAAQS